MPSKCGWRNLYAECADLCVGPKTHREAKSAKNAAVATSGQAKSVEKLADGGGIFLFEPGAMLFGAFALCDLLPGSPAFGGNQVTRRADRPGSGALLSHDLGH